MKSRNRFFQTVRFAQTGMGSGKGWGRTEGDNIFRCCFPLVISLMKWSKTQREIAMDGNLGSMDRMSVASVPTGLIHFYHFISEI